MKVKSLSTEKLNVEILEIESMKVKGKVETLGNKH